MAHSEIIYMKYEKLCNMIITGRRTASEIFATHFYLGKMN